MASEHLMPAEPEAGSSRGTAAEPFDDGVSFERASGRQRGRILFALAVASLTGGVGYWILNVRDGREPRAIVRSSGALGNGATAAAPPVAVAEPAGPASGSASGPASAPAARIKIIVTSTPSGADVCLARDNALLGRTRLEWEAERGSRVAKLWVRKSGYRSEQIAVSLDHETKRHVELEKLGPDDIADLGTCGP